MRRARSLYEYVLLRCPGCDWTIRVMERHERAQEVCFKKEKGGMEVEGKPGIERKPR